MAIYHLSVKTISRATGRSATAAAAYRAGEEIVDERTGLVHDYTRRSGVLSVDLTLPANAPAWASDRSALWNAAEKSETRRNSTVAREFEVALPDELTADQRRQLVAAFTREIADRHGVAVDAAIHAPDREGDKRNHHAHVLTSTRRLGPDGFTEKARELDDRKTGPELVTQWRERWGDLCNRALEHAGRSERVDHRTLKAQHAQAVASLDVDRADDLDRAPGLKLGPVPTLDLRRAERTKEAPRTERAEKWREVRAENTERRSVLRQLRGSLEEGIAAMREAAQRIRQGIAELQARARAWKEQQQAKESARRPNSLWERLQAEAAQRARAQETRLLDVIMRAHAVVPSDQRAQWHALRLMDLAGLDGLRTQLGRDAGLATVLARELMSRLPEIEQFEQRTIEDQVEDQGPAP